MITVVKPYTVQNRQKQNFCAINQSWANKIVNNTDELNDGFQWVIANREISKEDAVDTLTEVMGKLGKGYTDAIKRKIEFAKKYLS